MSVDRFDPFGKPADTYQAGRLASMRRICDECREKDETGEAANDGRAHGEAILGRSAA